ncbi:ganglioside GM2 activator-like [Saccostrea echinata]|uniref:ganglioside GM2 activator-like n=1 Tax=Saccostrea echinata TaxID=191078 RepID=UPI002A807CD1|nr:ganglioside GM2 activator-like [Saccostrea echinata]
MQVALIVTVLFISEASAYKWHDCVPSTTAHPWVTVNSISISPDPAVLPGNLTIGITGTVNHPFGTDVKMNVYMDKQLLGVWTKVPCANNVGSCNYDNPCEFLSAFKTSGTCPQQLTDHGLPCTCPFNPDSINLPPSVFQVTNIAPSWEWLATGHFRVRAEMIHNHAVVGCFELELEIQRKGKSRRFIFG